jgi:D-alanyl-D-alanine carboxypeptidase
MTPDKDPKTGEYFLYDKGKCIGTAKMDMIDGHLITVSLKPKIMDMQRDAAKEGVILTVDSAYRTFSSQVATRRQNAIDRTKVNDDHFILTADPGQFNPRTAIPGTSNHQDGTAIDFRTKDPHTGQLITGPNAPYKWLVKNAIKYGMIRTVPSERWHFESRPGVDMFSIVPKTHPTWDGLI